MQITEIKVFPIHEEKLKAFVSIVFDGCFMVNDIKIINGRGGLFISMPSRKKKNGDFKDVAHPLNNETRQMLESAILAEYEVALGKGEGSHAATPQVATAPTPAKSPADGSGAPAAGAKAPETPAQGSEEAALDGDKTLDEIQEEHLRDSYWSVQ